MLGDVSPFAAGIATRYPALWTELGTSGRLRRESAPGEYAALLADEFERVPPGDEEEFLRRLRLFRHRELLRIVWRDQREAAPLTESLDDLSALADAAINAVWCRSDGLLRARHGVPRAESGEESGFGIVAMGKLGGRELNFSSDVDLVFVYSASGETDGVRPLANEEYFRLLAQRIIDSLSRQTADGFVYRVDVRLRPFGSAGPLAVSLAALESYLQQNGRDWERYAWIKARVVNDWADAEGLYRDVLRPFIFRRYLDYGVFSSLREMKAMIEAEVKRREYHDNLKLGPGGIREIEFIVQALQLVRGGTVAALRERELLVLLPRLVAAGCLPREDAAELDAAYRYLRLAENRLQALHDAQTHDLPQDALDQQRLARAMGHASWAAFRAELAPVRETVARHFRSVVFRSTNGAAEKPIVPESVDAGAAWSVDDDTSLARLRSAGFADPSAALEQIRRLRSAGLVQRLDEAGRARLDALMPRLLAVVAREAESVRALEGLTRVLEAIGRRSAYFALLNENPPALQRLVRICAASGFLAQLVATHPLLLDELLDPRVFEAPPSRAELAADLALRRQRVGADDLEAQLDALRNFHQAAIFRVAVVDLAGTLPLMKVSDRLTDIAELVVEAALDLAWGELVPRHGEPACLAPDGRRPARFAVVGYGKLGGLELGYGSDLDLVFLHDSTGEEQQTSGAQTLDNAVFFARLTRRIIGILTLHTSSGKLYEVDIRLRPSGKSGLLVSSLEAFEQYQREDAWTWEHQALLRSRAVAGDPVVRGAFEKLRVRALQHYVHRDWLSRDVADMRSRMRAELSRGTPELLDLKQDEGGITDIEFLVQYLVLRDAAAHPALVHWSDNIRQLEALAEAGLLPAAQAGELAEIYRRYRQRLHHLNLAGQPGLIPRAEFTAERAGVVRAWRSVFYTPDP